MLETTLALPEMLDRAQAGTKSGLNIALRTDMEVAWLASYRNRTAELSQAFAGRYGVVLPTTPLRVEGRDVTVQWAGPEQWLVLRGHEPGGDLERDLKAVAGGLAAVADQSDARVILTVSGKNAPSALAKLVPIDLDTRVFPPGAVAITHAHHMNVTIARACDGSAFDLMIARSSAQSFSASLDNVFDNR